MSTVKANDLTNVTGGIPTVKSQQLIPTAWVNFNGTGTVAIRDSENVSSITDNNTGIYLINFITTMANTNYVANATTQRAVSWANGGVEVQALTTANFRVENIENSSGADTPYFGVQVMGGQS